MIFRMVYKSGQIFLPFCHNTRVWQTDGRTEFSSLDRVCIPCSAVKNIHKINVFALQLRQATVTIHEWNTVMKRLVLFRNEYMKAHVITLLSAKPNQQWKFHKSQRCTKLRYFVAHNNSSFVCVKNQNDYMYLQAGGGLQNKSFF